MPPLPYHVWQKGCHSNMPAPLCDHPPCLTGTGTDVSSASDDRLANMSACLIGVSSSASFLLLLLVSRAPTYLSSPASSVASTLKTLPRISKENSSSIWLKLWVITRLCHARMTSASRYFYQQPPLPLVACHHDHLQRSPPWRHVVNSITPTYTLLVPSNNGFLLSSNESGPLHGWERSCKISSRASLDWKVTMATSFAFSSLARCYNPSVQRNF